MGSDEGVAAPAGGAQRIAVPSISLPKGGGVIRGIGEKFATNPVTGAGYMSPILGALLAGDDADFVTGQTIWVDGGLFTKPAWPYE